MSSRWPLVLALLVGACNVVNPPQLLVSFEAEPQTTEDTVELHYRVLGPPRDDVAGSGIVRIGTGAGEISFPTPQIPVLPRDGDPRRLITVVGEAYRDTGSGLELFNSVSAITSFPDGLGELELRFTDSCIRRRCLDTETCIAGDCQPIPFRQARGSNPRPRRDIRVSDASGLRAAIFEAEEGDIITLAAGDYDVGRTLSSPAAGTQFAPIIVRAAERGSVRILVSSDVTSPTDGFLVDTPYWIFENLVVVGTCPPAEHAGCDHGFHIAGNGHHVVIRNNEILDFNQPIKSNQVDGVFPDDALIEYNLIYNTMLRSPDTQYVAGMFILASAGWVIRGNHVYGFASDGGSRGYVSGVDVSGGSRDALVEGNRIECEATGIQSYGLSWGRPDEGGSSCRQECNPSTSGVIRNNIVLCANPMRLADFGDTRVAHNTMVGGGVEVEEAPGQVILRGNLSTAPATLSDDAGQTIDNLAAREPDVSAWLSPPPRPSSGPAFGTTAVSEDSELDYCGEARGRPSIGAVDIASSCDASLPPP